MASKIPSLVTELESASVDVDAWSQQDPAVRRKICNTLRKLSVDLDTPGDLADRICYQVNPPFLSIAEVRGLTTIIAYGNRLNPYWSRS